MRNVFATILCITVLGLILSVNAFAQEAGDYRSAATGDWSAAATWETFDGSDWVAATDAPTGSETITIDGEDEVSVDGDVTVSGYVTVTETGVLAVGDGSLAFADGSTYEHARNAGSVPTATWEEGSTALITGVVDEAPDNRGQDYYHLVLNTPDQSSNLHMSLTDATIGGDITVRNTGSSRWYLTSASATESATVTINGDVIVEDGQFAVQGTGNAETTFVVDHHGDINVTGGNFSIARGSQGSGSGTTTWNLHEGNFSMSDAAIQNSNPEVGNAKFVFASDGTQQLTFTNVEYAGGDVHFEVADTATLEISDGVEVNGLFANRGEVVPLGALTFVDGGIYEHAQDGGTVPTATWEEGSTALFTGITGDAPDNRGQDYHHLTLNTPDLASNNDLSLGDHTIGGNLTVMNSGSARWRLVGGSDATITIMGDVIVQEDGSLETQGTGSATTVEVHHYGNVDVDGGAFSVSRGSQGSGTGTTTWYLYEGDFSMTDADTRNSNPTPGNAKFLFASGGMQHLALEGSTEDIANLSIEVADSTTLDLGMSEIVGNGIFVLQDGATVATAHMDGLDGNLQLDEDGLVDLGFDASFTYNGTDWQWLGALLPDTLQTLTIANPDTVAAADTNYVAMLLVDEAATLQVDSTGSVTVAEGGTVDGNVVNSGELITGEETTLTFGATATYEHARNGGSVPSGTWAEGSTALFTGITSDAPDNRGQDYHHLVLNTPDQSSNLHMSLTDATIGGDITVRNTGSSRWYLTSASATESATVTINGDVIVEDGQFAVQGTGNAETTFVVDHHGDINVTGGNFSIARGSQGSGSGTTTWNLHEGDFSMSGAATQNSNPTSGNAKFVFAGEEPQQLVLGEENDIQNLPIEVSDGATLDMGTSELTGGGPFMLNSGATLATAHPDGVAGAIQTTGDVTLDEGANFTFNGTDAQVTSTLMPATVNDLTIDNEAGVELSQETMINGILLLAAGEFDNTISFTMGPEGSIVEEGGSLAVPVAAEPVAEVPTEFDLYQNYPNPFNPSTVIQYDISERSNVTIKIYDVTGREVMELVNEQHGPGSYQVEWNAGSLSSGVYFYRIHAGDWSATRSLQLVK